MVTFAKNNQPPRGPRAAGASAISLLLSPVTTRPSLIRTPLAMIDTIEWFCKRLATVTKTCRAQDRVSFADGYPLLLATEESLAALNDLIAEGQRAAFSSDLPLGQRREQRP